MAIEVNQKMARGTSSLLRRQVDEKFNPEEVSTTSFDSKYQIAQVDGTKQDPLSIKCSFWDLSSGERWKTSTVPVLKGANIVVVALDLTLDKVELDTQIKKAREDIANNCPGAKIFLVGTKSDLLKADDFNIKKEYLRAQTFSPDSGIEGCSITSAKFNRAITLAENEEKDDYNNTTAVVTNQKPMRSMDSNFSVLDCVFGYASQQYIKSSNNPDNAFDLVKQNAQSEVTRLTSGFLGCIVGFFTGASQKAAAITLALHNLNVNENKGSLTALKTALMCSVVFVLQLLTLP